jgi:hypothetical protein
MNEPGIITPKTFVQTEKKTKNIRAESHEQFIHRTSFDASKKLRDAGKSFPCDPQFEISDGGMRQSSSVFSRPRLFAQ